MKILGYIFKRILQTIPLLFLVSVISFFIIRLSPVDPLGELRLNPSISHETLEKEQKRLGLDKPIYIQYLLCRLLDLLFPDKEDDQNQHDNHACRNGKRNNSCFSTKCLACNRTNHKCNCSCGYC